MESVSKKKTWIRFSIYIIVKKVPTNSRVLALDFPYPVKLLKGIKVKSGQKVSREKELLFILLCRFKARRYWRPLFFETFGINLPGFSIPRTNKDPTSLPLVVHHDMVLWVLN